jgi:hypothetical protein
MQFGYQMEKRIGNGIMEWGWGWGMDGGNYRFVMRQRSKSPSQAKWKRLPENDELPKGGITILFFCHNI